MYSTAVSSIGLEYNIYRVSAEACVQWLRRAWLDVHLSTSRHHHHPSGTLHSSTEIRLIDLNTTALDNNSTLTFPFSLITFSGENTSWSLCNAFACFDWITLWNNFSVSHPQLSSVFWWLSHLQCNLNKASHRDPFRRVSSVERPPAHFPLISGLYPAVQLIMDYIKMIH